MARISGAAADPNEGRPNGLIQGTQQQRERTWSDATAMMSPLGAKVATVVAPVASDARTGLSLRRLVRIDEDNSAGRARSQWSLAPEVPPPPLRGWNLVIDQRAADRSHIDRATGRHGAIEQVPGRPKRNHTCAR